MPSKEYANKKPPRTLRGKLNYVQRELDEMNEQLTELQRRKAALGTIRNPIQRRAEQVAVREAEDTLRENAAVLEQYTSRRAA